MSDSDNTVDLLIGGKVTTVGPLRIWGLKLVYPLLDDLKQTDGGLGPFSRLRTMLAIAAVAIADHQDAPNPPTSSDVDLLERKFLFYESGALDEAIAKIVRISLPKTEGSPTGETQAASSTATGTES